MTDAQNQTPYLILPVGTQVVTRIEIRDRDNALVLARAAVGVIVAAPADNNHSYQVRFPDGFEAAFRRQELTS